MMTKLWILGDQKRGGSWSQQEHKIFENALAYIDCKCPDRWERVAAMTGKTVEDVIAHYYDLEVDVTHIEAGLIPFPGYSSPSFTLDWDTTSLDDGTKQSCCLIGGKRSAGRLSDQERKKGVPWTEEEHKLFLMGLKKYGKGDWRNISRNFVLSRTPTQVASHAQKYFIRLNSGGKDKRRASIHDITTINLPDNGPPSPSQPSALAMQSSSAVVSGRSDQLSAVVDSDQPHEVASAFSPQTNGNQFVRSPYHMAPYG